MPERDRPSEIKRRAQRAKTGRRLGHGLRLRTPMPYMPSQAATPAMLLSRTSRAFAIRHQADRPTPMTTLEGFGSLQVTAPVTRSAGAVARERDRIFLVPDPRELIALAQIVRACKSRISKSAGG